MKDQIITLEIYQDPALAHIIRARLESNGISCFLADENMIGINPLYNQALGGIKLKIFEHDLEKCREILAEDEELELEETAPTTEAFMTCPYCHSTEVRNGQATTDKFSLWTMLLSFIMLIYPFYSKKAWHCFNCGKDFNEQLHP